MDPTKNLYLLTATEILKLQKEGTVTVEEYAQSLLSRIEQRDGIVKAWQYLGALSPSNPHTVPFTNSKIDREYVLHQARKLDQIPRDRRGPLHGVAVGIKDIMDTKGSFRSLHRIESYLFDGDMPTEYGSPLYQNNRPNTDAAPVELLRGAGALIMGQYDSTQFEMIV